MTQPSPSSPSPTRPIAPVGELLEAGRTVGRYRIRKLAGMGGMGEVYQAWDTLLERYVALKAVRPARDGEDTNLERFRREALALAQLNHPHVCQVHDLVQSEVGTFIAMEWLEGQTLDQAAGRLGRRDRLRVAQGTAEGLAAAHAKGLVHRDLKPSNVMVTPEGQAKILDFGLARQGTSPGAPVAVQDPLAGQGLGPSSPSDPGGDLDTGMLPQVESRSGTTDPLTQVGFFMGSPRYASPEQIRGRLAGPPSDVFSLGVLLWELTHDELPYPGEGRERFQNVLAGIRRPPRARRVPPRLARLLDAMLAPKAEDRPSAEQVAGELKRIQRPLGQGWWVGLGAAATLLLLLGGYLILDRGVVADLTKARPARVAILPVENATDDPSLQANLQWVLPDVLGSALRGSARLAPLSMEALPKDVLPNPSLESLRRVAKRSGADLLLLSTLRKGPEGRWILSYRLLDRDGKERVAGTAACPAGASALFQDLPRQAGEGILRSVDPLLRRGAEISEGRLPPEALQAYAQGKVEVSRAGYREARDHFRRACEAAPYFGAAAVHYGICLQKLGEPGAEAAIQWGRWAGRATGNRRTEIQALTQWGILRMEQGRWDESRAGFEEAMRLATAAGDEDFESAILNNLGYLALERNQRQEAEQHLHRALLLHRKLGKHDEEVLTLNNLAVLAKQRGDFRLAEGRYREVLEASRASEDRWAESMALNNLGDVALCCGELDTSERYFQESLRLKREIGHRAGTLIPLANLGILARVRADWPTARTRLDEALALARELKRRPLELAVLLQQGALGLASGRPAEALDPYREARALALELADAEAQAQALAGKAEAQVALGQVARAEALLQEARAHDPESLFILRAQGALWARTGRSGEARRAYEAALARARTSAPEEVPALQALLQGRGTPAP